MPTWKAWTGAAICGAALVCSPSVDAFPHVVQKGETLAAIAERVYGRIHYERVLVYANALDVCGGTPIAPGMLLDIPAASHRRVAVGDTWQSLAQELLGDPRRADVLAKANDAKSWEAPQEGADIVVPYNLRFVVDERATIPDIASRFFADRESAWMLDRYNNIGGRALGRGELVLVPLVDLPLTEQGKEEARRAEVVTRTQGEGQAREIQRKVAAEVPQLLVELRGGLYLEAVVRANRLLALGELTRAQTADIHRVLTEAYVALDATGLAAGSCQAWQQADPSQKLDPVTTSPKILAACAMVRPGP